MDIPNEARKLTPTEAGSRFRFAVLSRRWAMPPDAGGLQRKIAALAAECWRNPMTKAPMTLSRQTIGRRSYLAKNAPRDPAGALRNRPRRDAGRFPAVSAAIRCFLEAQHRAYPRWTYLLHHENLLAAARSDDSLGRPPSYPTLLRSMRATGLLRDRRRRSKEDGRPGQKADTETWRLSEERLRRPTAPVRMRHPPASCFGWVDRRLVADGHLARLTLAESRLYFFLYTVADARGLSFRGDARLSSRLRPGPEDLDRAHGSRASRPDPLPPTALPVPAAPCRTRLFEGPRPPPKRPHRPSGRPSVRTETPLRHPPPPSATLIPSPSGSVSALTSPPDSSSQR